MNEFNELLLKFEEIAKNPKKQLNKYLEQEKKVVLCAPVYTPDEIIHSMGMIPFGAWGADVEIKEAKEYFPAFICSVMQSILELGMNGEYDGVSAIVIPSLCDSLKCLGQNWKYAVKDIPFIPMTYPQNRKVECGVDFTTASYKKLIRDLEKATGKTFSEDNLGKSLKIYNDHNNAMRRLSDKVADSESISVQQRSNIFKSAYFMDKEEHTALVEELIAAIDASSEAVSEKTKIIVSGILADNSKLLEILDDNGFHIVADDLANESRQYRIDAKTEGGSLENLSRKFADMGNCSVLFDPSMGRADFLAKTSKEKGAEGVIFFMTKFCDPEEFDYVFAKKALDDTEIPNAIIEIDRQMDNYEQARTIIETFKTMLESQPSLNI
jgi:bcr-type benzoyl-CoA reductase subunit C